MTRRIYVQNVVPQDALREQSSLLKRAKKSLSRFDKNLNPEDFEKVMAALNGISELLGDRTKPEEVENECDCVENGRVCQCVNDDDDEVDADPKATPDAKMQSAIARDWDRNRNTSGVLNALERKSYHQNSAHSREVSLIRNASRTSGSFLDEKDLSEIAARNARSRKR